MQRSIQVLSNSAKERFGLIKVTDPELAKYLATIEDVSRTYE